MKIYIDKEKEKGWKGTEKDQYCLMKRTIAISY